MLFPTDGTMAIKIITTVSKKIPIAGLDYSSVSASCTVEAEIADLTQVAAQAQALYAQVEHAVDQQLMPEKSSPAQVPAATPTASLPVSHPRQPDSIAALPRQGTSAPYHPTGQQRRGPAPVTDSQLRFLKRLIDQTGTPVAAILDQHRIGGLDDLSCKAAAQLIDELKAGAVRA